VIRLVMVGAATTVAVLTAPVAGADGNISDTIACGFYAEDESYFDTGVGYAEARKAAEDAECFVHSDPHGGVEEEEDEDDEAPAP
jgi:hypothetical protein